MPNAEVRAAYAERSAEYTELLGSMDAVHPADRDLVTRWAGGLPGAVIDAGCGPGHWTNHLVEHGLAARGVDQVSEFIERARSEYPNAPFVVGSIDSLDAPPASVGGVLAWYSLIHHDPDRIRVPLWEFARVLAPGGGLLVGFFEGPSVEQFDHAVVTGFRWPVGRLSDELDATGFDVIETHTRAEPGTRPQGVIIATRGGRRGCQEAPS